MTSRKPPRVATWFLNRFGLARQNPPLVGDLLEEFREGRSAGWYWRQTLIVILMGMARNVRRVWRPLTGTLIGWTLQAGVALTLWRFHFLPYLPHTVWAVGVLCLLLRLMFFRTAAKGFAIRKPRAAKGLAKSAGDTFSSLLLSYCVAALLCRDMTPEDFIFIQVALFLSLKVFPGASTILMEPKQR